MSPEQILLGCMILDDSCVDRALHAGLSPNHFESFALGSTYASAISLKAAGDSVDLATIAVKMGKECPLNDIMEAEASAPTTAAFSAALESVLWANKAREIKVHLDSLDLNSREKSAETLNAVRDLLDSGSTRLTRGIREIALDAIKQAEDRLSGAQDKATVVKTTIIDFDKRATPIGQHEYCVVGARTSHGKSALLTQIANYNEKRGLKVVYFTLETSDTSVFSQMAGQRARVNLRNLREEVPNKQKQYIDELKTLQNSDRLLIFDKDLSLDRIESRCRLLASSFKPDLVCIDYMGLVGMKGYKDSYERMGAVSKAMIPLRKSLGCSLLVAAQINRGPEKENRPPSRSDFRDAGGIEEDAHRIIAIHRPVTGFDGVTQDLDRVTYDCELLQLKLRDGPLTGVRVKFNSSHTVFSQYST